MDGGDPPGATASEPSASQTTEPVIARTVETGTGARNPDNLGVPGGSFAVALQGRSSASRSASSTSRSCSPGPGDRYEVPAVVVTESESTDLDANLSSENKSESSEGDAADALDELAAWDAPEHYPEDQADPCCPHRLGWSGNAFSEDP